MTAAPFSADLVELAARVRAAHQAATGAQRHNLEQSIVAGELLIEAKGRLEHGQWLPWLRNNCGVPPSTASLYMRLARGRADLEDQNANVSDLTVRKAQKIILGALPGTCRRRGDPGDLSLAYPVNPHTHYI